LDGGGGGGVRTIEFDRESGISSPLPPGEGRPSFSPRGRRAHPPASGRAPSPLAGEGGREGRMRGKIPRLPVARPLIRPFGAPSPARGEEGRMPASGGFRRSAGR